MRLLSNNLIVQKSTLTGLPSPSLLAQSLFRTQAPQLDGTILDESPGLGTARPMQPHRCYQFDGGNDSIQYGGQGTDPLITTGDFTISIWVKPSTASTKGIVGGGNPYSGSGLGALLRTNSGRASFLIGNGTQTSSMEGSGVLPVGVWSHIVVTGDRSGPCLMYVNGNQVASTGIAAITGTVASSTWHVGRYGDAGSSTLFFGGGLFDARVYESVLKPAEVTELYQLGAAALPSKPTVLHYKMDGQHATLAYDSSGNDRDGTKTNHNAAVGQFHYEGSDVPFSWQNDVGYSTGLVPRDESDKANDVDGNPLEFSGKAPRNARLSQSFCGSFVDTNYATFPYNVFGGASAFTVSFWMFPTGANSGMSLGSWNAGLQEVLIRTSGTEFQIYLHDGTTQVGGNMAGYFTSDVWQHVLVEYTGSEIAVYVNGVKSGTTYAMTNPIADVASATDFMGSSTTSSIYNRAARMAGVSVYSRAMTANERLFLQTSGASGTDPTDASLIASIPCSEGAGAKIHDTVTGTAATVIGINEVTFWGTRQPVYHRNAVKGFTKYEHATLDPIYVPYGDDGEPLSYTTPSGYTKEYDHPPRVGHNGAESLIDPSGGVSGIPALAAFAFDASLTNPNFKRRLLQDGDHVATDRIVIYKSALAGTRLLSAQQFTADKALTAPTITHGIQKLGPAGHGIKQLG